MTQVKTSQLSLEVSDERGEEGGRPFASLLSKPFVTFLQVV